MQVITADFFRRFINGEKNIPTAFDFSDSMQPPFAARYRDNVELWVWTVNMLNDRLTMYTDDTNDSAKNIADSKNLDF